MRTVKLRVYGASWSQLEVRDNPFVVPGLKMDRFLPSVGGSRLLVLLDASLAAPCPALLDPPRCDAMEGKEEGGSRKGERLPFSDAFCNQDVFGTKQELYNI